MKGGLTPQQSNFPSMENQSPQKSPRSALYDSPAHNILCSCSAPVDAYHRHYHSCAAASAAAAATERRTTSGPQYNPHCNYSHSSKTKLARRGSHRRRPCSNSKLLLTPIPNASNWSSPWLRLKPAPLLGPRRLTRRRSQVAPVTSPVSHPWSFPEISPREIKRKDK